MNKKLVVIDLSSFIYRAFYAIAPLTTPEGTPVNAVYGIFSMLQKLFSQYNPSHILIARDSRKESFRKKIYPEYKVNRQSVPENLIPQFALIETLIQKMQLRSIVIDGYEADDLIGSVVVQWKSHFEKIYIASSDKDLMQFVDENTFLLDAKLEKIYGKDEVIEKMGVAPSMIVDYLAIVGDDSDNIPGVKGIGSRGGQKLLNEFHSLENILNNLGKITNKKLATSLVQYKEDALLSKKLATIVTDIPIPFSSEDTLYNFQVTFDLLDFIKTLGFKSFINKLSSQLQQHPQQNSHPSAPAKEHKEITNNSDLENFFQHFDTNTNEIYYYIEYLPSQDMFEQQPMFVAIKVANNFYFLNSIEFPDLNRTLLSHLFSNSNSKKEKLLIGADIKRDAIYILTSQIKFNVLYFDILKAHYLIDVTNKHNLNYLSSKYLQRDLLTIEKKETPLCERDLDFKIRYAIERVEAISDLYIIFKKHLHDLKLEKIFYEIDNPLSLVLAKMEIAGIKIDCEYFKILEKQFQDELTEIEIKIEKLTSCPVNLKSPKQVSELLFDKLQLPTLKKGKTYYSTDSEVLEELDELGVSEIPALILRYRELDKLLSTYLSVLPTLVNQHSGRIHTHFNDTVTTTGRLSSDRPNLQNIPVRSVDGKKIRKGFISSSKDNLLLSADYSQVELRLLAHFSKDDKMMQAFLNGEDIHTQTAAEIFAIPLSKVTNEDRGKAKAVNFGLMYGQSSFGLSQGLKISRFEAKEYITKYFERFHKVKTYIDYLKERCAKLGYAETLLGRKRFVPEIHSQNRNLRSMAERLAINTPIQGTAADIIKIAMIKIQNKLEIENLKSKMLLQVHDELIFEVPREELESVKKIVTEEMKGAEKLLVSLEVNIGSGNNWQELK
ncbi:MAG: DNA polymerase I [Oligoflexia bacterium]|nr:DNA polymerase I [Oligoflexia bacterium]